MQIVPAVTELLVAQFMWLDYDNPTKPIYLYINSSGTQVCVIAIAPKNFLPIYDVLTYIIHIPLLLFSV